VHHQVHRRRQALPPRRLDAEPAPPGRRQAVVLELAIALGMALPSPGDEALVLQPVQRRVERTVLETQDLAGRRLNRPGDVVTVGALVRCRVRRISMSSVP
jgi:hypothetical protein